MTKQEEIKKGLSKMLDESVDDCYRKLPDCSLEDIADQLLKYLHSQGVVIKVDRELPNMFGTVESYLRGFRQMRKAGFVAVEPIIEKERNEQNQRIDKL